MDNKIINLPKGFLKQLNDLNQDAKTIYDKYYLHPDGVITSEPKFYKYKIGSHFCKTDFTLSRIDECFNMAIVEFDSDAIYRGIKDFKKYINCIAINDDLSLHLIGENDTDIVIGCIYKTNSIKTFKFSDTYLKAIDVIKDIIPNTITISDDDVEDLVKNQYKNYGYDKYRTRITREVIPGLKKTHKLRLSFYDNAENGKLFNMRLVSIRTSLTSYHNYTCIFL